MNVNIYLGVYTFQHPYLQHFSISYPIIRYIIKNPKYATLWERLIKTCKYFYSKNRVLPVWSMKIISASSCNINGDFFDQSVIIPKLWVYNSLIVSQISNLSNIIPSIFKFDLHELNIGGQNLSWNDYHMLTSSFTIAILCLYDSIIKYADGTIVTVDKLLENLQKIESFDMTCAHNTMMFKDDTVKKIVNHLNGFKKMHSFRLFDVPESFDFASFKKFLLKNEVVDIRIFYFQNLTITYKEMIKNTVKEIKKNPLLSVPEISLKYD